MIDDNTPLYLKTFIYALRNESIFMVLFMLPMKS